MLIRQTWTKIFSSTFWRLIKRTDCVIKRIDLTTILVASHANVLRGSSRNLSSPTFGFGRHLNVWKQCLYKNLTSNNFQRTAVLKKYDSELSTKASVLGFHWRKLGALHALEDLEPHFKFSKITDKYMENLKQASGEIYAQVRPQFFLV